MLSEFQKGSAREAALGAYCPYSGYQVGASVKGTSGHIFTGCNIENVSYGATVCAERVAIFKMISEDPSDKIKDLIVYTKDGGAPCGICRQVISEFSCDETVIYILDKKKVVKTYTMDELLPDRFKSELVTGKKSEIKIPKKGAAKKLAKRLKELGDRSPPKELVETLSGITTVVKVDTSKSKRDLEQFLIDKAKEVEGDPNIDSIRFETSCDLVFQDGETREEMENKMTEELEKNMVKIPPTPMPTEGEPLKKTAECSGIECEGEVIGYKRTSRGNELPVCEERWRILWETLSPDPEQEKMFYRF